jgi:hypothetical protein
MTALLPAALVFGIGLSLFVAPVTQAALGAVDERHHGLASGVNNAVARLAGLLATATLPGAAGLGRLQQVGGEALSRGFVRTMWICSALCALGAAVAFLTVDGFHRRSKAA